MNVVVRSIHYFKDENGKEPVKEFLIRLGKKKKLVELNKINSTIGKASNGNFGKYRFLGGNLVELKIDYGPGYRIYCGIDGDKIIILVNGGTKKTQDEDIEVAKKNWEQYLKSKKN